jgi:branched-chain amino acid transport system permease protein
MSRLLINSHGLVRSRFCSARCQSGASGQFGKTILSRELGYWLQQFLNACTLASFFVPLAVAYALVQGITNKIFLSFGYFAMNAAFAAIYAGLASLLVGNNTAVILAISLALAVLSSSALGRFAATHVFAPLIRQSSQAFMIASIGVSIALQEMKRIQSANSDLWMMPLFDGAAFRIFDGSFPVQIRIMQIIAVAMAMAITAIGTVFVIMKFTAAGRYWKACLRH